MKLKCLPEKIYLFQFLVYASTSKFISQNKNILWYLIKFSIWYLLFSSPCFSVPPHQCHCRKSQYKSAKSKNGFSYIFTIIFPVLPIFAFTLPGICPSSFINVSFWTKIEFSNVQQSRNHCKMQMEISRYWKLHNRFMAEPWWEFRV